MPKPCNETFYILNTESYMSNSCSCRLSILVATLVGYFWALSNIWGLVQYFWTLYNLLGLCPLQLLLLLMMLGLCLVLCVCPQNKAAEAAAEAKKGQ